MADELEDLHSCSVDGEEKLNAEGEVALARLALDGGDLPHAATHLGNALAEAPRLPEVHEALAEFARRAGGAEAALDLFSDERPYIGAVACQAHLLAAAGRWDEALSTLAAVVREQPDRPWAEVAWVARQDLAESVSPQNLASVIARIVGGGVPDPLPPELTAPLRPFLDLARASLALHPDHALLLTMASGLARRFAAYDQAIAWAGHAQRLDPGHTPAVMLGYALRAAGRVDEALACWEAELARDPSDLSLYVDVAELYAMSGRPEAGLPWLERALAVDPAHPQAAPAIHGVRFAVDGGRTHLLALADHLRDHPEHGYAHTVLQRHSENLPWLSGVTGAREATVNVLHQFLERAAEGGDPAYRDSALQLNASVIEAPSAVLTLRRAFPKGEVSFGAVPEPDPRPARREVATAVWRYEGLVAEAAVPEPPAAVAEAVRAVAELRWPYLPAAYDHAVELAAIAPADLLGVLVHPPLPREDEQGRFLTEHLPELWIRSVQAFACLGIAHHGTDEPWEGSVRRRILLDLLDGPEDWVTEAAGFALLAIAWSDPATREDIGRRLVERMLDAAEAFRTRPVEILGSLCHFVLGCAWLDATFTGLAADLLESIRREDEEEPDEEEVAVRGAELVAGAMAGASAAPGAGAGPGAAPGPGAERKAGAKALRRPTLRGLFRRRS
ncbi:tetratricopeptide repeat protein [Streptomyces sp. SID3212]|uniref:tetratricopeptide repeat protein n=1 Tax=Streptomyces sp. SID3212 TaxID=2690259 RepID=UPI001368F2B1|nr:tetratricopeptide repeat protein [Streptomyces sp. SID3212]MYV57852.1 hypothetical protein [Streptomyces sp. SID3212]